MERRVDFATRKRVAEMSADEMKRALGGELAVRPAAATNIAFQRLRDAEFLYAAAQLRWCR